MLRIWIIDKQTGELLKRTRIDSYEPIIAANETSMLINENDDWYITDDNFNVINYLIQDGLYNGKEVYTCKFTDGKLKISFKDFSEQSMELPFFKYNSNSDNNIKLKFLDTDHNTYEVTCCSDDNIIWKRDESIGELLEYSPEMIYESPSNNLYLLWTENKLVALSKLTGETVWTFLY